MISVVNYNLRPVWDAILDVYQAFAKVCDKHGLRYYVTGGTLLGAVRHNGFIPWDDDFDIVMPRPDYRKFFDVFCKDLPTCYAAEDFRNPKCANGFSQMFGKVYDTRFEVTNRVSAESHLNLGEGIFIDVIPIDGMPKSNIPFAWWAFRRMTWRHQADKGFKSLFWKLAGLFLCQGRDLYSMRINFEKWLLQYDYDRSPCVEDYNANGRRFKARALYADSFGMPVMHQFENIQVPMPKEYEKFLTLIYGNYMQFPPLEKRVPSHQTLL